MSAALSAPSSSPQRGLFTASADLTSGQRSVILRAFEWRQALRHGKPARRFFFYAGLAGTGKTHIVPFLLEELGFRKPVFAAFSGKAASVLRRRGLPAQTLHSLLYRPVARENEFGMSELTFERNPYAPLREADVLFLDEASMCSRAMLKEALSFEVPIIALGDALQLPPVDGDSPFATAKPDFVLTEIRRQARDNPIIAASLAVREDPMVDLARFADGERLIVLDEEREMGESDDPAGYDCLDGPMGAVDQLLCGTNANRTIFNRCLRQRAGFASALPGQGARLSITKNNADAGLWNRVSFDVEMVAPVQADRLVRAWDNELRVNKLAERREHLELLLRSSDVDPDMFEKLRLVHLVETGGEHRAEGILHTRRILEEEALAEKKALSAGLLRRDARVAAALGAFEARWGYAATVHKAQGSGFGSVGLLLDPPGERNRFGQVTDREQFKRWLYTGITRAAEKLIVRKPCR